MKGDRTGGKDRTEAGHGIKVILLLVLIVPLFITITITSLYPPHALAQQGPAQPPPVPIPPGQVHPKLETVLQVLVQQRLMSLTAAQAFAQAQGITLEDDLVKVIIEPLGKRARNIDRAALQALGARVEATSRSLMRAKIPLLQLIPVADTVNGISFIRRPNKPHPVAITSEGVSITGASAYHSAGYWGQNVKVAIIDLGFSNLSGAISNGEFGSGSGYGGSAVIDLNCTKDYSGSGLESGTSHGTGVAEIVHDMAPQATLCLMKISDGVDLENAKDDAKLYGAKVINHSVAWFNTNFYDGTGTIANIAADARNNNILWVNAAGNEADGSMEGHWQGSFTDSDGDRYLDFGSGSDPIDGDARDECNDISATAGEGIYIYMSWDDWTYSNQNYNLYLYNSSGTIVASSTNFQTGSQPPTESIFYYVSSTGTYCFAIYDYNAPSHPELELYIFKEPMSSYLNLEYHHPESSIPAPGNDEKVLTVGAIYYGNWTTGPQEPFSSQGPTNNSKYATSRTKPDLMGPDGVSNYNYAAFYGTSAASPHVAGAAALLLSEDPTRTANDLQTKLEADAIDMGAAGKDNIYGSGRLNLVPQAPGTAAVFRVTKGGDVYADRAYFCGLSSGCFNTGSGADIAEVIRVSEPVAPGDLVELDPDRPGRYRKARGPYSTLVAGVISTAPGITMGGAEERPSPVLRLSLSLSSLSPQPVELPLGMSLGSLGERYSSPNITLQWTIEGVLAQLETDRPLLALIGVVPVKATAENGPIRPGDLLVSSSTLGYVMRCGDPDRCEGAIVGKALEPLAEGEGLIEMLVMR